MPLILSSAIALLAAAPAAAGRCPATDFATFATRFADDVAIQRKHTAIPLTDDHIDADADPGPATITRKLDATTLRFPVMPDRAARAKDGRRSSAAPHRCRGPGRPREGRPLPVDQGTCRRRSRNEARASR